MSAMPHVYWFTFYSNASPSVRYRATYPLKYVSDKYHVSYSLIHPGYAPKRIAAFILAYIRILLTPSSRSLIVIQRVHSNFIYATLLKALVKLRKSRTVYDLDDADYLYWSPKTMYWFAKNCAVIASGSKAISDHLSNFNANIIHSTSTTPDYEIAKTKKNEIFTIGWIGSFGGDHKKSLIATVFPAILRLEFECEFHILGITNLSDINFINDYFKSNPNISIVMPTNIDWEDETTVQNHIVCLDVGIATLLDNEIQLSKSGIKVKQYLNNGIPVLSTNLPENDWVINEGKNGYYCDDSETFYQRLNYFNTLTESDYMHYSKHARSSIKNFNHEVFYENLERILTLANK